MIEPKMQYLGDSKISSAERDYLLREPGHVVTAEELLELVQAAGETHAEFYAWIKPRMTVERAARVRDLRCGSAGKGTAGNPGWSYRRIAGCTYLEWGRDANWQPITNQLAGVALCEAAAELLGENYQEYPWQANQA